MPVKPRLTTAQQEAIAFERAEAALAEHGRFKDRLNGLLYDLEQRATKASLPTAVKLTPTGVVLTINQFDAAAISIDSSDTDADEVESAFTYVDAILLEKQNREARQKLAKQVATRLTAEELEALKEHFGRP